MLAPFEALKDFIADPSGHGLPFARRMALQLTARIPDVHAAADAQDELCAVLETLVRTVNRSGDFMEIDEAQQNARGVLDRVRQAGRQ